MGSISANSLKNRAMVVVGMKKPLGKLVLHLINRFPYDLELKNVNVVKLPNENRVLLISNPSFIILSFNKALCKIEAFDLNLGYLGLVQTSEECGLPKLPDFINRLLIPHTIYQSVRASR